MLVLVASLQAQGRPGPPTPYISPGFQIGFLPKGGMFWSAQVTIGILPPADCWPGYIPLPSAGVTVGLRNSKQVQVRYIDIQVSATFLAIVGGVGIGQVFLSRKDQVGWQKRVVRRKRFKAFGGSFLLGTYDTYKDETARSLHHFGLMGVLPLPIPLDGVCFAS